MGIRALSDHVIVRREGVNSIIQVVGHKEHIGEVVAVGPGKHRADPATGSEWFCPMTVKTGDRVMFSHRAGMETEIEGQKLLVMHEADILCVMEPDAAVGIGDDWRQESCDVVGTYNVGTNGKAVRA